VCPRALGKGLFEGNSILNPIRVCPKNEIVKTRMRRRCYEIVYFESISFFPEATNLNTDIILVALSKTGSLII
jgi:hypothetical protein